MKSVPAIIARLNVEQARALTDEVKADAARLWAKLLMLYEGDAHLALGYSSWAAYYTDEFGESKGRSYQLLAAARVDRALAESTVVDRPANEGVARELVPVLRGAPEQVVDVWTEVVAEHGPTPTAQEVREVVRGRREPERRPTKDERRQAEFFENALTSAEIGADEAAKRVQRAADVEDDEDRIRAWLATAEATYTNAKTIRTRLKGRLRDAP